MSTTGEYTKSKVKETKEEKVVTERDPTKKERGTHQEGFG